MCWKGGSARAGDALFVQQFFEFTRFKHFHHDGGPADEFTLHIKLRDGWPVGIGFDATPDFGVLQHIYAAKFHAKMVENCAGFAGRI